ncbi:MAG: hypothetical protein AAF800_08730 [Planctomycetota bacterium]
MDATVTNVNENPWTEPAVGDDTATPQSDAWSGDRPIWLTLAASALAAAAAVPVILIANGGWVPVGHLLYTAVLAGLLVGTIGLLVAGLVVGVGRVVRAARRDVPQAEGKRRSRSGLRNRLALN